MTDHFWHKGIASRKTYLPEAPLYTDPHDYGLLTVERDEDYIASRIGQNQKARHFFDALRYGPQRQDYPNNSGVWLWRDFILPGFPEEAIISLKEGQTDLFEVPAWLRKEIGIKNLFIKMEGQNPSESFKDRGMPVAVSDALRLQILYPDLKIKGVCCASTGDTSAAAAIYSAYRRDLLSCIVFVPHEKICASQLFQAMAHGAKVIAIDDPQGFDACMKKVVDFGRMHPEFVLVNSKNDMRLVGQETIGLEILQDLRWNVPDWISIPVGNGGNLSALLIGLLRAKAHGLIDRLPGIIGAQAEKANTLARWQESGFKDYSPGQQQETVASAMNINDPVSYPRIKDLIKHFNIHFTSASEERIKDVWMQFMRAGANICPQTAVALSGAIDHREAQTISGNETVVVINTASGLKFADAGIEYHMGNDPGEFKNPYKIAKNLAEIERILEK